MIGRRYRLLGQLGSGGMGVVYRAADRLTGQTVALKRVTAETSRLQFASQSSSTEFQLALAQEFKTLASMRHPNVISVLDYGFETATGGMSGTDTRQPFFTMDLIENGRTILEAARNQPLAVQ